MRVLLTWTRTLEQLAFGAAVSIAVAVTLVPLGDVVAPWRRLSSRRLAARIWAPSRPLRSGMVIVPIDQRTDFGLTVAGLVTSPIVGLGGFCVVFGILPKYVLDRFMALAAGSLLNPAAYSRILMAGHRFRSTAEAVSPLRLW